MSSQARISKLAATLAREIRAYQNAQDVVDEVGLRTSFDILRFCHVTQGSRDVLDVRLILGDGRQPFDALARLGVLVEQADARLN